MYGSHVWPRNRGYFRPRTLFKKCFDKSTLQVGISFEFGITNAVDNRIGQANLSVPFAYLGYASDNG